MNKPPLGPGASPPGFPLPGAGLWRGLHIGLMGGSFNPAHVGHRHISLEALKRLKLDFVWWLVSPQNPLKPVQGMAPLADRLESARAVARHPRIRISALELQLKTRYTCDTIAALQRLMPHTRFVWLGGADSFLDLPRWRHWRQIMTAVPIAVFDRPHYSLRMISGKAANCYRGYRLAERSAARLAVSSPPRWVFLHGPMKSISATEIRRSAVNRSEPRLNNE